MIERLLLYEYSSALARRTAIDTVGRLLGVALAVVGLAAGGYETWALIALGAVATTSALVWQMERGALTRQILGLEQLLGKLTRLDSEEDAYVASRRFSEARPGWAGVIRFEPLVWLYVDLALIAGTVVAAT
jgi:hypothetical protein